MRMTYSPDADALGIRLASGAKDVRTRELAPSTFADFDADGRLVGIEVLNASTRYELAELERLESPAFWLTLAQAAKESKLAVTTIRNQIINGRLPGKKQGRDWVVARHDLWNYLENRAPQGRPAAKRAARRLPSEKKRAATTAPRTA